MSLLNTLLGTITLCAALLLGMSLALGPDEQDVRAQPLGLTAAAVLASDGMGPDGRMVRSAGVASGPGRIAVGSSGGAQPAG